MKRSSGKKDFFPGHVPPPVYRAQTFFGIPYHEVSKNPDFALAGAPFDLGVTIRGGTRFGPREIRNQ